MPVPTPLPDNQKTHYEVVMKGLMAAAGSNAIPTVTIFHFRRTAVVIPPSKTSLNTIFQSSIAAVVAAALNARWAATINSIRCIDDPLDAYADFTNAAVGAISGDSMASDDTAFILLKTGIRGKSYQGRKLLGPMSESDSTTTGDVFNSNCITRLTAIGTAIVNGFTDGDGNIWKSQVLSTKNSDMGPTVSPATIVSYDIASALVNHRIGTLLRRKTASVY